MAERKPDFALAFAVDILPLDLPLGAMAQDTLDPRGDLGGGTALEVRVETGGFFLHVPINHDPSAAISHVPFGHQVLIPGPELLTVCSTRGWACPPAVGPSSRQWGIDHAAHGFAQRMLFKKAMPRIQEFPVGEIVIACHQACETHSGSKTRETEPKAVWQGLS